MRTRVLQVLLAALFLPASLLVASAALADGNNAAAITITSTSVTSTSMTINWSIDPGSSQILSYEIQSLPIYDDGPGMGIYDPNATSATLTGLTPATTYNMEIIVNSAAPVFGNDTTTYITVTTATSGVTTPTTTTTTTKPTTTTTKPIHTTPTTTTTIRSNPTAPIIKSLTPTTSAITIRWLAPTSPESPVTRYIVAVLYKNKAVRTGGTRASARALVIHNLKPHTTYTVVLAARLKSGNIQISGHVTTK